METQQMPVAPGFSKMPTLPKLIRVIRSGITKCLIWLDRENARPSHVKSQNISNATLQRRLQSGFFNPFVNINSSVEDVERERK